MIKWVLLIVGIILATSIVVALIKIMLKSEKVSKKISSEETSNPDKEYQPEQKHIDIHSASSGIPVTDMSVEETKGSVKFDEMSNIPGIDNGFLDELDDDFADFSDFAHNSKGRRSNYVDFDLDGDLADEYIPDSPDFSYIPKPRSHKKRAIATELNEMPTELKVLMLSDIFDRKFFD